MSAPLDYCGEFLDPRAAPVRPGRRRASRQSGKAEESPTAVDWVLCFLCPGIGCIVGVVALIQGYSKRGGIMILVSLGWAMVINVLKVLAQGGP